MDEEELELIGLSVVCHTEGCENEDITIEVLADAQSPVVICGPCGQEITDVTPQD